MIHLFQVGDDNNFIHVYSKDKVKIHDYYIEIKKGDKKYKIYSNYNIKKMMISPDLLAAFEFNGRLYPLPLRAKKFSPDMAIDRYKPLSLDEIQNEIFNNEEIKILLEKLSAIKKSLLSIVYLDKERDYHSQFLNAFNDEKQNKTEIENQKSFDEIQNKSLQIINKCEEKEKKTDKLKLNKLQRYRIKKLFRGDN